jgi:AcrR family transcriptional regulator
VRLAAEARRRALLDAAAALLARGGPEAVQFGDVAAAAGVTRQLVYKFYPNRPALVIAVVEDFARALTGRFAARAAGGVPESLADATRLYVEGVCDTIEAKGVGAWRLLDARGPDAEIAGLAAGIETRLVAPWRARIAATTGASRPEVTALARMIVAACRAVLDLWYGGELTRDQAVRAAARGVSAMLDAFSVAAPRRSRGRTSRAAGG